MNFGFDDFDFFQIHARHFRRRQRHQAAETAKWYRDVYRRYRDYSIVATAAVYLLQVIDANVFAYMHDFEVTDDLTMNVSPTVILPYNEYAMNTPVMNGSGSSAVGMRIGFTF